MPINGLLLIDKDSGPTSHDVVARVRRILNQDSVGHTGTLDPLASGLMVLLLGHATKLSEFILTKDKSYEVTLRLGVKTDSGDRTGKVVEEKAIISSPEDLQRAVEELTGEITLAVPIFSATKVKGKKLYEYARAEVAIETPKKLMNFYNVEILSTDLPLAKIRVSCSKGSFIRSWVEAIGEKLGCGATVEELRRIDTDPFSVKDALTLDALSRVASTPSNLETLSALIAMNAALPNWFSCQVKGREEQLLRNGQISHDLTSRLVVAQKQAHKSLEPVGIKVLGGDGELVGLLAATPGQGLKIRRIFAV